MTKTLWIICFVLVIVFIYVVSSQLNLANNNPDRSISGVKIALPELGIKNLSKPPIQNQGSKEPNVRAKTAILIDGQSFKRLYVENPNEKVPVASTTKIMTSLVILEDYPDKLNEVVTITRDMVNVEGSDIQLRPGEKMTVENILKGLLIVSGNDAAISLASFLGGKEQFVAEMNEKASFLGLKNTLFKDPAGLDDTGYSTAEDLAVLGAYALRNKTFAEIVKTPLTTITSTDGLLVHNLKSSNRMLRQEEQYYFPLATGIKTGFTNEAGHCLVGAAQKGENFLVSVILYTDENTLTASAKESKKLLEWGFNNWTW